MENLNSPDIIANAVLGLTVIGTAAVGFARGLRQRGKGSDDPDNGETVKISGALIDGRDARALMASLDKNTAALNRCGAATEKSADRVEEATREIRRMTDEMIRGQH